MQVRNSLITAGIIGALSVAAFSAYAKNMSANDFVQKASIANKFEIDSSHLALERSQNGDVKSFAQRMVDDHTTTGDKLKEVLESSKSQAEPADELDDKHQKLMDKLQRLSGRSFDSQYISMQNDAHKEAVKLFTEYSKHGKDPALKSFAAETLPTLKQHLNHVQQMKK